MQELPRFTLVLEPPPSIHERPGAIRLYVYQSIMFFNKPRAAIALAVASLASAKNISVTVGGPGGVVAFSRTRWYVTPLIFGASPDSHTRPPMSATSSSLSFNKRTIPLPNPLSRVLVLPWPEDRFWDCELRHFLLTSSLTRISQRPRFRK